jgi:hypothetical protein
MFLKKFSEMKQFTLFSPPSSPRPYEEIQVKGNQVANLLKEGWILDEEMEPYLKAISSVERLIPEYSKAIESPENQEIWWHNITSAYKTISSHIGKPIEDILPDDMIIYEEDLYWKDGKVNDIDEQISEEIKPVKESNTWADIGKFIKEKNNRKKVDDYEEDYLDDWEDSEEDSKENYKEPDKITYVLRRKK